MSRRPNIVLILADDLGYSDLGCYGGEIETPSLDRLAASGMRFAQFYNCARCAPTRASLLTGLYPHKAGVGYLNPENRIVSAIVEKLRPPGYLGALNRQCATIPEILGPVGYRCYMAGKWHLGAGGGQRPLDRGFHRYYGILSGASDYWNPRPGAVYRDQAPDDARPPGYYTTDAFTDAALEFVEETPAQAPYFLYLAYNAPHWPLQAAEDEIARCKERYRKGWDAIRTERLDRLKELGILRQNDELAPRDKESYPWEDEPDPEDMVRRMATYAAVVERMDRNIGRLLDQIERRGESENTLVLFLSDNGAEAMGHVKDRQKADKLGAYLLPWANASNTPFRYFKIWVHEGGICTPLIASWPGVVPPGAVNRSQIGHVKDLMATFLDLAGIEYPFKRDGRELAPLAGQSLLPALLDPAFADDRTLYWEHGGNCAMRKGRWKLTRQYNDERQDGIKDRLGRRQRAWELFDMETDRTELRNRAADRPEKAREWAADYERWAAGEDVVDWETVMKAIGAYDSTEAF